MRLEQKLAEALRSMLDATAINPDFAATGRRDEQQTWDNANAALAEYDARQPLPASQTGLVNGRGYNEDA